jgi:hypothetical protein
LDSEAPLRPETRVPGARNSPRPLVRLDAETGLFERSWPERFPHAGKPPTDDEDIESLLAGLMGNAHAAAQESFQLASDYTQRGELIEMRDVFLSHSCRATKALAMLVAALARHGAKVNRRSTCSTSAPPRRRGVDQGCEATMLEG